MSELEKSFTKTCHNCRKEFQAEHQASKYCSLPCQNSKKKRRKNKSKSDKKYVKKHNVSRALETSSRKIARKIAQLVYDCKCYITGKEYTSWEFLQVHHIDGNPFNNNPMNLIPLSPAAHASIKEAPYEFGITYENGLSEVGLQYEEYYIKHKQHIIEQISSFKYVLGKPIPKFNEK